MPEVTKRDAKRAARVNAKEAASVPLLAYMGAARTVTAEDVAERREKNKTSAEVHIAWRVEQETRRIEEMRAEVIALVGPENLAEYFDYAKVGQPGYTPLYVGLASALGKARRGEPLFEPVDVSKADAERAWVDPDLCFDLLNRRPMGFYVHELATCLQAGILDTVAALRVLADLGRARVREGGGWAAL